MAVLGGKLIATPIQGAKHTSHPDGIDENETKESTSTSSDKYVISDIM